GRGIDDETHAPDVIGDQPIRIAAAEHVRRRDAFPGIHEAAYDRAGAVELGDDPQPVRIQPAALERAVDALADAPAAAVDDILDLGTAGQRHADETAERIVRVR